LVDISFIRFVRGRSEQLNVKLAAVISLANTLVRLALASYTAVLPKVFCHNDCGSTPINAAMPRLEHDQFRWAHFCHPREGGDPVFHCLCNRLL